MQHLNTFVTELGRFSFPTSFQPGEPQPQPLISYLNDSVLAGEYYNYQRRNPEDAAGEWWSDDDYYAELQTRIAQAEAQILKLSEDARNARFENAFQEAAAADARLVATLDNFEPFRRYTLNALDEYKKFILERRDHLNDFFAHDRLNHAPRYLIQSVDFLLRELEKLREVNAEAADLLVLLYVNLHVAELDEHLACTDSIRERLERYARRLDPDDPSDPLIPDSSVTSATKLALYHKVKYLLRKITFREGLQFNDNPGEDPNRKPGTNLGEFEPFWQETVAHYNGGGIINPNLSASLSTLHGWNRYVRKAAQLDAKHPIGTTQYPELLASRMKQLEATPPKDAPNFQRFANLSAQNLLFNTAILLKLRQEQDAGFRQVRKALKKSTPDNFFSGLLGEIVAHQTQNNLYDYKPYETCLRFLDSFIQYIREDGFRLLDLSAVETSDWQNERTKSEEAEIRKTITEGNEGKALEKLNRGFALLREWYQKTFVHFNFSLRWCKERNYNPIYLSGEECRKNGVFLDSAYVLPDNYRRVEQVWMFVEHTYETNLRLLEEFVKVEVHRVVTDNNVQTRKEEFEKKVKENEFKTVQIVAMFVSIAAFVLANVQIFNGLAMYASMSAMFGLAACLLLFNAFFKWVVNGSLVVGKSRFKMIFFVWDLILIVIILACGWLSWELAEKSHALGERKQTPVESSP